MKVITSFIVFMLCANSIWAQVVQPEFELLGRYRGWGGLVASAVAAGREAGSERLYASFLYNENTIDVISVDPGTGATEVFHSPIQGDFGARNMAVGPDGNVYLGTLPHAHFLKLDRKAGKLIDLGQPSPGEQYIWDVTFGPDNKLYGATYPGCKLVRYDPASGKLEDLGRMDPTEQYARWIAAGSDGFVYIGIGTTKANIAAFDVKSGQHWEILPAAETVGTAKVFRAVDGNVYGSAGQHIYQLVGGAATEWKGPAPAAMDTHVLRDGRVVKIADATETITVMDPKTHAETVRKVDYEGNGLALFRVGFGPDDALYGSSILPIHFVRVDRQQRHIERLTKLGGGEVYSMLARDDELLMGAYAGTAPLMAYAPGKAVKPGVGGNPAFVNFAGAEGEWRPEAMVEGPDHHVYIGAVPGYGRLEEPLLEWQPATDTVAHDQEAGAKDQNLSSLTVWRSFVVAGTTIYGGGGSHPTETQARLLLWNTTTHHLDLSMVPVPGAQSITDLIAAPNGLIYGIAGNQRPAMLQQEGPQHPPLTLFVFDPGRRKIVATKPLPFTNAIYNSVAVAPDGAIWGLAEEGIFRIDPHRKDAALVARAPEKITGGFALREGCLYFVAGPSVYRYRMQEAKAH